MILPLLERDESPLNRELVVLLPGTVANVKVCQ